MNPLVAWVKERESIRKKKEAGLPPPWTIDPILAHYRFCNAYRELDDVTKWIYKYWLKPHEKDPDVWFAAAVARFLNLPETLTEIGYPVPWNSRRFAKILSKRRRQKLQIFNGAYMISSKLPGQEKYVYLQRMVFGPLWKKREKLRPRKGDTLEAFHQRLLSCYGLGGFLAAQIVADVKHLEPLKSATDWWDFAASGPGSRRGLNRLLGRPVKAPWREEDWRVELAKLRAQLKPEFEAEGLIVPDAQNFQNQLCEISKYEKTRLGEGHPKRKYVAQVKLI